MTQRKNLVKYTLKDSIFTNLFSHPEYLLQLYKTLHPEDTEATEDSLTDIPSEMSLQTAYTMTSVLSQMARSFILSRLKAVGLQTSFSESLNI